MKHFKPAPPIQRIELALVASCILLLTAIFLPLSFNSQAAPHPAIPAGKALAGGSMWIWYMPKKKSQIDALLNNLRRANIKTVIIKSGDGINTWQQFNTAAVDRFHQAGLHVCAWHYVYGSKPLAEAQVSSRAYQQGAECLIIDAEGEYADRSKQATQYLKRLRALTSKNWLLGLSAFPYTYYHKDFPYQVFLGPGGATVNLPQMYWKDIGVSPAQVVADTYELNQELGKPVYPAGQTWRDPDPQQIKEFLQAVKKSGAPGWSWWDYNQTSPRGWQAIRG